MINDLIKKNTRRNTDTSFQSANNKAGLFIFFAFAKEIASAFSAQTCFDL